MNQGATVKRTCLKISHDGFGIIIGIIMTNLSHEMTEASLLTEFCIHHRLVSCGVTNVQGLVSHLFEELEVFQDE